MDSKKRIRSNLYGWNSIDEVAEELCRYHFDDLLCGMFVFAYKNLKSTGTIKFFVVSKTPRGYRLCYLPISEGYTSYYPVVNSDFLLKIFIENLERNKTDKNIIEDFIDCITYYDKT